MTTLMKSSLSFIGMTAIALSSTAVSAQVTEPVTKTVSYSDLDLSTAQGQKRFETRIKGAVQQVCTDANSRELKSLAIQQQCRVQALNSAKREMKIAIARYNNTRVASR
jgi:UrcA family protein